jgi:outer membrane protein assembly factor BamB
VQEWQVALKAGPVVRLTVDDAGIVYGSLDQVGASPNLVSTAQAFALDPRTQHVRWQQEIKESATVLPVLSVAQGTVYLGTESALVALDATTGSERWHYPLTFGTGPSQVVVEQVAVDQEVAYFGVAGGFYALHAASGTLAWHHADSSSLAFGTPVITHGVVFTQTAFAGPENFTLDTGRHVYAFRASDGLQYYRH